jgi:spermidine/putrescine transport system substrate-binding protein
MSDNLSRKEFLRRGAAGGALLAVPGLLSACGGGIKSGAQTQTTETVTKQLAKTLNFSNWPLYIDVGKSQSHPRWRCSPNRRVSR